MILFHSTDEASKDGIEARGFAVSHLKESPGGNWFWDQQDTFTAARSGWFVIVQVPLGVALKHADHISDVPHMPSRFFLPWGVVNKYRPFKYERWEST